MVQNKKNDMNHSSEFEKKAKGHLKELLEKQPFAKVVFHSLE